MAGPRIRIRRPRPEDVEARQALGYSSEVLRGYGVRAATTARTTREEAEAWLSRLESNPHGWVIEVDGRLAGQAGIRGIVAEDKRGRFGIGLLNAEDLGHGIGRRAARLVLAEAFGPLGLHRVELRVLAANLRAIRCYQACGFRHEGTERESALTSDGWQNDWIMGLLAHEFRALPPLD